MSRMRRMGAGWAALLVAVVAFSGCDSKATRERLTQLTTVSAEKDSLLALVSENTRLMADISTELAKVKSLKRPVSAVVSPESPLAASVSFRDSLRAKIKEVVERVTQAEARLAASQRRIRNLGSQSDSLKAQLATAEQAIADIRSTIEGQRGMITTLEQQSDSLKQENGRLVATNAALADTMKQVVTENNTVYYVIGTKDELKEKGIVAEEGGFLFFGGKALVPGWNLEKSQFTATDRRSLAELTLPRQDRWYQIVSRQNLQFLSEPATKEGKVKGSLHITEPEEFWGPSRFLIVVEG